MSFTVENLEFYLLVLMRISAFVLTAPFFNYNSIPARMKAALSLVLTIVVIQTLPVIPLSYIGVLGFSILVLKETVVGMILGFLCNVCFYIINFAGHVMDMEMGLAMASLFDPATNVQITVTGNIYNYFVMLMLVVTNSHYYIIRAITDSFSYFNVGQAVFQNGIEGIIMDFMGNYFLIAVRICLPIFCCMMLINVILGVLTRNMFVVGIQIKVLAGLVVLVLIMQTLPTVSDFIFTEMKELVSQAIRAFTP